jgi:hypothetical protein
MTVWADVLHDGPTPGGLSADAFRRVRARHLAARFHRGELEILDTLQSWDDALDRFREHEEVVFWFEHDLFDQLILIRHLHWLSTIDPRATRFSLICIGTFPDIEDFSGLGQLTPAELETLPRQRQPITSTQIRAGRRAWEMFCAPDPAELQAWLQDGAESLPFLTGALRRHFEDYPSTREGLSRTERQVLMAIAEGHDTFGAMFRAGQVMEERVYMGDATFRAILEDLVQAAHPLIEFVDAQSPAVDIPLPPTNARMRMTGTGRDVLEGRLDHVSLNGIDRWMGGVHLTPENCWRSDGQALIRPSARRR